jgi:biuret amidohydrolase
LSIELGRAAVVTQECQKGVLGDRAVFPQLADAARTHAIPNAARIVKQARSASVPVIHCIAAHPPGFVGYNTNARLFGAARKSGVRLDPGTEAVEVIDELRDDGDIISMRFHGIGPMWDTDLDPILRNLDVRTIVVVGVSVNIGVTNLVMDAVNASYNVILPRDAVCGIPSDYADAMIDNTLSLLATITTTDEVVEALT